MTPSDDSDIIRALEELTAIDPSPETIRDAVERTRRILKKNAQPQPSAAFRHEGKYRTSLARPVALLVAVVMSLVGLAVWLGVGHAGNSAFAQMQKAMDNVATVTMTCEFEAVEGRKQGDQRVMIYDGNRMRIESLDGDSVTSISIHDLKRRSVLTLHPATKRWFLSDKSGADGLEEDYFTRVRQYRQGNAKQLPDREVGGKRMLSFEVEHAIAGYVEYWTIFADPESKLPQRIESVVKNLQGDIIIKYVCKDFSYEHLDDTLFALDPPEGYENLYVPLPPKRVPQKATP